MMKKRKQIHKLVDKITEYNIRDIIKNEVIRELELQNKIKSERKMDDYMLAILWKRSQLERGHITVEEFINETKMKDYIND